MAYNEVAYCIHGILMGSMSHFPYYLCEHVLEVIICFCVEFESYQCTLTRLT
jgi:hypothetical protein